jgi:hypothetical protein
MVGLSSTDAIHAPPLNVGIAVAGGGLGGLALGVGLLERGFDIHIFEAAQELRTDSGTIVSLAPNGEHVVVCDVNQKYLSIISIHCFCSFLPWDWWSRQLIASCTQGCLGEPSPECTKRLPQN